MFCRIILYFPQTYIINNSCNFNLIYIVIHTLLVNLTLSITVRQIPDAVDTVVCAPDDG